MSENDTDAVPTAQKSQPTEPQEEDNLHHRICQGKIGGKTYYTVADSKQNARLNVASKYKTELLESSPSVGISVEEYARDVEITEIAISYDTEKPLGGAVESRWGVANGDPYIAVLYRTEEESVIPSKQELLTLGTGFESYREILIGIAQRIQKPDLHNNDPITFVPTGIEIYSIIGSTSIDYTPIE